MKTIGQNQANFLKALEADKRANKLFLIYSTLTALSGFIIQTLIFLFI